MRRYFRLFEGENIYYAFSLQDNISILVESVCGKQVALHRAYEETNLTTHLQGGCNLKYKQPGITSFFSMLVNQTVLKTDESEMMPVKGNLVYQSKYLSKEQTTEFNRQYRAEAK
ncbi:6914_t:CDS:2 [Funneliformis geosporum]|nr:6914_t:CDS:2 [Funneliformis geosporum]